MSRLAIKLLGTPEVAQDGEAVSGFRSIKARALLYYVAANEQRQARAKVAGLLWGELPDANANANLRKTLTNLRQLVGPYLTITRYRVGLNEANLPWLDTREFETALDSADPSNWQAAVDLYRGDFLEGFYLAGAPEFETWLLTERYRLREKLLLALHNLAKYEAGRGHYTQAIHHAQHILTLEPLREVVHRLLMKLFAQSGQRGRALAQYEACARILAEELAAEPGQETTALFRQIRDGALGGASSVRADVPRHNLPAPTTSFVGREAELARIKAWLGDATGRLLTIAGSGGAGKTRLALHAAWAVLHGFAHGVWSVPLTSLADVADVPAAIAAALGITFFGKIGPETQVINYLRRKELLLILDNAEHLISQTFSDFIVELLSRATAVKIIVTSRQRLMMQAEQILDLPGLAYPDDGSAGAGSPYPAGQLFLERARNHGAQLAASPVDTAVYDLCRLVDGLPLALELAATWTSAMSLPAINAEIERGITFLTTEMHDVPPRHRNTQAVFDTSWQLLEAEERRIMRQLAYFRGGFSARAAADVVGATAAQLEVLVNKSLIRHLGDGRYNMHELIRQYAARKLAQDPAEAEGVARQHGRYFADFLATREAMIQGADYLRAKADIQADVDNVRLAWEQAVASGGLDHIARSAATLHDYFFNTQGLFAEAAHRFQTAAAAIIQVCSKEAEQLAGGLWLKAAVNRRMLGQLTEAGQLVRQSLEVFYRHELPVDVARANSTLAVIRLQQNEKKTALQLAETAVTQAREADAPIALCLCLNNLAYALAHNGDYEAAVVIAEESTALARANAYPHGQLSAMNMLGVYYEQLGETEKAETVFEELVDRCRETATRSRLAQSVNNLGALYKKRNQLDQALPLLQEAVNLYEAVGQEHYAAFVKVMLGEISLEQGNLDLARHYCRQALQVTQEIEMPELTSNARALRARLLSAESGNDAPLDNDNAVIR